MNRAVRQEAFLVFSGGSGGRNALVGKLTEAEAYKRYALAESQLSPDYPHLRLEVFARDSVENLIFTVALLMKESVIMADPSKLKLTVVGWEFKRDRYAIHAAALRV